MDSPPRRIRNYFVFAYLRKRKWKETFLSI